MNTIHRRDDGQLHGGSKCRGGWAVVTAFWTDESGPLGQPAYVWSSSATGTQVKASAADVTRGLCMSPTELAVTPTLSYLR
jgi:hypothetical protein